MLIYNDNIKESDYILNYMSASTQYTLLNFQCSTFPFLIQLIMQHSQNSW